MEKKYNIKYLPSFYRDLDAITDYIKYELQNEVAANRLVDEIENEIIKRLQNPESFEKFRTRRKRLNTYYRIYVKNYTTFYVVKDNTMEVRRIIYFKRNFEKLI